MPFNRSTAFGLLTVALFATAGGLRSQPSATEVLTRLKGHTDTVEAVAVSPDGTLIATGSFDRNVMLFNAESGQEIRTDRKSTRLNSSH